MFNPFTIVRRLQTRKSESNRNYLIHPFLNASESYFLLDATLFDLVIDALEDGRRLKLDYEEYTFTPCHVPGDVRIICHEEWAVDEVIEFLFDTDEAYEANQTVEVIYESLNQS